MCIVTKCPIGLHQAKDFLTLGHDSIKLKFSCNVCSRLEASE